MDILLPLILLGVVGFFSFLITYKVFDLMKWDRKKNKRLPFIAVVVVLTLGTSWGIVYWFLTVAFSR